MKMGFFVSRSSLERNPLSWEQLTLLPGPAEGVGSGWPARSLRRAWLAPTPGADSRRATPTPATASGISVSGVSNLKEKAAMTRQRFAWSGRTFWPLLTVLIGVIPGPARAGGVTLTEGEVDLAFSYKAGDWGFRVVDVDSGNEYDPKQVTLFAGPDAIRTQPSDPRFAFIGAGAGNPFWLLPQIFSPGLLSP